MNDHDVETRLRRHAPAAPPPGLRARVVDRQTSIAWQLAAAALLLLAETLLHSATERIDQQIAVSTGAAAAQAAEQAYLDDLARQFGDDPNARLFAAAQLERERTLATASQNPEIPQ